MLLSILQWGKHTALMCVEFDKERERARETLTRCTPCTAGMMVENEGKMSVPHPVGPRNVQRRLESRALLSCGA